MTTQSQRGSAIVMLFIAVALFGAIAYAFMQGSRNNLDMITSEKNKAAATGNADCTNAVNMATKRLTMRGCSGSQISMNTTGSVGAGPADGSCAVYHPNGGGVKACGYIAPPDPCLTGALGAVCTDGAIYIGIVGGNRIYAAPADEATTYQWRTSSVYLPGAISATDGLLNTSAIITDGPTLYPAAQNCINKAPTGTWYLPAKDELNLLWANSGTLNLASIGIDVGTGRYWTSTNQSGPTLVWTQRLSTGSQNLFSQGTSTNRVRCVRR